MHDIAVPLIDTTALLLQSETDDVGSAWVAFALAAGAAAVIVIVRFRLWSVPVRPIGPRPVELPLWMVGALIAYAAGSLGTMLPATDDPAYARLASGAVGNAAQVLVAAIFLLRFTRPSDQPAASVGRALRSGIAAFMLITPIVATLSIWINALLVEGRDRPMPQVDPTAW